MIYSSTIIVCSGISQGVLKSQGINNPPFRNAGAAARASGHAQTHKYILLKTQSGWLWYLWFAANAAQVFASQESGGGAVAKVLIQILKNLLL